MKELRLDIEELEQRIAPIIVQLEPPGGVIGSFTFDTGLMSGEINFVGPEGHTPFTFPIGRP